MKAHECIFFQLAKANQSGSKYWKKWINLLDLTPVQGMIMNFLHDNDQITSSELGKRAMLDSATLTGVLDRLETASLVERKTHPEDRRAIQVCLTEKGKKLADELQEVMIVANKKFFENFSDSEQKDLQNLLIKIKEFYG